MDKYMYDNQINALSIKKEKYSYTYSMDITDEIILDLDENKKVIGLEILNASSILEIDSLYLKEATQVNVDIAVKENCIIIDFIFTIDNESKYSTNLINGLFSSNLNCSFAIL